MVFIACLAKQSSGEICCSRWMADKVLGTKRLPTSDANRLSQRKQTLPRQPVAMCCGKSGKCFMEGRLLHMTPKQLLNTHRCRSSAKSFLLSLALQAAQ